MQSQWIFQLLPVFNGVALMAHMVKNLPAMQETWVWFLGQEDPPEKGMAIHSSILTGRISWTGEFLLTKQGFSGPTFHQPSWVYAIWTHGFEDSSVPISLSSCEISLHTVQQTCPTVSCLSSQILFAFCWMHSSLCLTDEFLLDCWGSSSNTMSSTKSSWFQRVNYTKPWILILLCPYC